MKIQYCSDLHMEFHGNMRFMKSLLLEPVGDALIIAGDVGCLVDSAIPIIPPTYRLATPISSAIPSATFFAANTPTSMIPL